MKLKIKNVVNEKLWTSSYLLSLYANVYLNRCTYCKQCKKEAVAYQVKKLIKFNKRTKYSITKWNFFSKDWKRNIHTNMHLQTIILLFLAHRKPFAFWLIRWFPSTSRQWQCLWMSWGCNRHSATCCRVQLVNPEVSLRLSKN